MFTDEEKTMLNNCIEYLAELWENDSEEEWKNHWQDIIGASEEQMKKYNLVREGK